MREFLLKVKHAIRHWLGLGELFISIDIGIRDQSCIVIASRLNDGTVKIIDARFSDAIEIEHFVRECQQRYGVPNEDIFLEQ